jgi:hypothetical protein
MTWTVRAGDIIQLASAIAMLISSVYAIRAWRRLNDAAERYTRALVAMQEDAAAGRLKVPPG